MAPTSSLKPLRQGPARLVLSTILLALSVLMAPPVAAHNLDYAVARADFTDSGQMTMAVNFHIAAFLMGVPQGHLSQPVRARWAELSDEALGRAIADASAYFGEMLVIYADGAPVTDVTFTFPDLQTLRADGLVEQDEARPSAPLVVEATLPAGTREVAIAMPLDFDQTLLRLGAPDGTVIAQVLRQGELSHPFQPFSAQTGPQIVIPIPQFLVTFWQYTALGFEHILPLGLDHILFVVCLFLLIPAWRPLTVQVTAFTVAHSVTLALSVFGVISLPPVLVEPLIAASIAVVALDNLFTEKLHRWRTAVVFGFGLLHGIGFATALKRLGLPGGQEALALISFNVGVELGQLAVLALTFAAFGWFISRSWYRERLVMPLSLAIAGIAAYWTVERLLANL